MTSIVKLEALSGVRDDGPLCYLLQVDETYLLLDCGWDETFDLAYIDAVKARIPQISAVLLSYADQSHLGALPYLVAKCGLTAPVYATVPVYKMGQMFLYDWVNGHQHVEEFEYFSLDDVDSAFDRVQQVKYNQTVLLKGDSGIQFTPLQAGHMLGGAIWKISKQGDEEIIYAVDFNHKKERHLNGCTFDTISRPHLLITDAYNALYNQPRRKDRDEQLVTRMLTTVRGGGDCLVVIDTAGRVLEVAHLLDQLWANTEAGLMTYNLVLLSNVASSVVEFAKSQVEWMSDKVLKSFETGRSNPFAFRHVQLCHSQLELDRVRSPKVVLCSGPDMESGFSRELFLEWSSDTRNTIIVTSRSGERTLGSNLIRMAQGDPGRTTSRHITLEVKRRIRLEGKELDMYRRNKMEKEQEAARQRLEASRRQARKEMASDSEDSDDDEAVANVVAQVTGVARPSVPGGITQAAATPAKANRGGSTTVPSTPVVGATTPFQQVPATPVSAPTAPDSAHDLLIKWEHQQKSVFFKQSKKSFPMFPFVEEKVKWDDYGEIIRPEDYFTTDQVAPTSIDEGEENKVLEEIRQPVPLAVDEVAPTKCVKYIQKMEVMCNVEFIDFEGRSDGESIKKLLAQMKPKQLIVVHGSNAATRNLAQYATDTKVVAGKIFTPRLGEIVDATVESHIFQVAMSDALMTNLFLQGVREAELAWLDARIVRRKAIMEEDMDVQQVPAAHDEDDEPVAMDEDGVESGEAAQKRVAQKRRQDTYILDVLTSNVIPNHPAVFVNDPRLSDMKQLLINQGFQAEFSSGVLYINGVASIRRNEAGRFHVEGRASAQYYKIRDIIYQQFAIV